MTTDTDIVVAEQAGMTLAGDPDQIIADASRAAKALSAMVESQGLARAFGKGQRKHLQFEAWQTIGQFYGVTSGVEEGSVQALPEPGGYRVYAYALRRGVRIGGAWASCSREEPNWRDKPDFQVLSMAQTRAMSKALRSVLAHVAVLAGYEPTPAEEMTGQEHRQQQEEANHGTCPVHSEAWLEFTKGDRRWYSHRQGDGWCNKDKVQPQNMPATAPSSPAAPLVATKPSPEPAASPVEVRRYPDMTKVAETLPEVSEDGKAPSFWKYAIAIWGPGRTDATARLNQLFKPDVFKYRDANKLTWKALLAEAIERDQSHQQARMMQ